MVIGSISRLALFRVVKKDKSTVFGVFVNEGIKLSRLTIENPSSSLSHMTMGVGGFIAGAGITVISKEP